MSRRKDPVDELAGQIGCLIIGLLWAAVVGLLALIFKASQTSPEDKLRRLQPSYAWNWQIEARDCFQCGTVNESYVRRCYRCGAEIAPPPELSSVSSGSFASVEYGQAGSGLNSDQVIGIAIILIILTLIIWFFASGVISWQ